MKTSYTFAILFFLLSMDAHSQTGTPISELYPKGKFNATCAIEIVDHATIRSCTLCPIVLNPNSKQSGETRSIEMTFESDSLLLDQAGELSHIPITRNKNNHSISFVLNKKSYAFRVFLHGDMYILEDSDGLIVVLEKAA